MASYKEIVTKAVIGKGRKTFTTENTVTPTCTPNTILGCWVINHDFKGEKQNDTVIIDGTYDINIWYSCEKDSKTEVIRQTDTYHESVIVPRRNQTDIEGSEEVIIRSLKQPSCSKVEIIDGQIKYTVEKDLGIEIVGDTKVKIAIDDSEDDWDLLEDDIVKDTQDEEIDKQIDETVNEEFL